MTTYHVQADCGNREDHTFDNLPDAVADQATRPGTRVWSDALTPAVDPAPTDRQRMEMYRAEMNRLQSTLNDVVAQRDALARDLLSGYVNYSQAVRTILTDLIESGNVADYHGLLS